jgi:tetratricopeptide (TPR) repeat protein
MKRRRRSVMWALAVALTALIAGGLSYFRPWDFEARLGRADLLALDALTAEHPDDARIWYYMGLRFGKKGAVPEAAVCLTRALQIQPEVPRYLVAAGRLLLENDRVDEAFQVLKRAEAALPAATEPRKLLGRLYQRRGTYLKAEEQWRAALALKPDDAEAWYYLGYCHLQMQQVQPAAEAAEKALKLAPNDPDILRLRGSIAAAKGDLEVARESLERAVRVAPRDPRPHHDLANFLLTQARSDEAVARAEEAVRELARLQPDYPLLSWHRARLALFEQDWPTAIRLLNETLQAQPGLDEAYFHLANAYHRVDQEERGNATMAEYRRRAELTRRMDEVRIRLALSEDPELYFELGRLRREAGLLGQAREAISEGLRLKPESKKGKAELAKLEELRTAGASTP